MKRLPNDDIEIGISGLRKLTEIVKTHHNFDLSIYAGTALKRRVSSIILQNNLKDLEALINILSTDPSFFDDFLHQLTVEGTEFFRDPAFWRNLRDDICPALGRNHMKVKMWIPGCSSGEEVVSLAITLMQAGIYDKTTIIATDTNRKIVENSRSILYSNNKLEISENNYKRFQEDESADMSKYCVKQEKGFRFKDDLYRNVVYDLFNGEENSKIKGINVILCRNYFIYFTAPYQERLLEVLTRSLNSNGYLAIGNKENIGFCKDADKYSLINESEKIYKKQAN